jgi:tRNA-specific 2-thiouridylase
VEALSKPYTYEKKFGKLKGKHSGAHYFTIGQRKGLQIGGTVEPLFVIATDVENNIIYTGEGEKHPGLYRQALFIGPNDVHWIREDLRLKSGKTLKVESRIRYRQPLQKAELIMKENGLYILFEKAQKGITPGQFAAWYSGEELLGSGLIFE